MTQPYQFFSRVPGNVCHAMPDKNFRGDVKTHRRTDVNVKPIRRCADPDPDEVPGYAKTHHAKTHRRTEEFCAAQMMEILDQMVLLNASPEHTHPLPLFHWKNDTRPPLHCPQRPRHREWNVILLIFLVFTIRPSLKIRNGTAETLVQVA